MGKKVWNKKTHEQYIKQLKEKGIKVEPLEEYINDHTKILHRCECNETWKVIPNHVLRGVKCDKCKAERIYKKSAKTHEQYVKEIEQLGYDIEVIGKYVTTKTKIEHKCPICKREDWMIDPSSLLRGNVYMCSDCSRQYFESRHATILKQIYKHFYPNVVWEDKSCINPLNNRIMPTDIVDHERKISIEVQSEFHDDEYSKKKDLIKKEYWENLGFKHYQVDIRNYSILEMIQIFFPHIKDIPNWVEVLKPLPKKSWSVVDAQQLLDEGYSAKDVALKLKISSCVIYTAIKNKELIKPKDYKIHRDGAKKRIKQILQLDLDGNLINEYNGFKNIPIGNSASIQDACVGKYKKNPHEYKGFLWFYKDSIVYIDKNNKSNNKKYKNIIQLDMCGNFIKLYKNKEEIKETKEFNPLSVYKACNGYIEPKIKNKDICIPHKYKGYLWFFEYEYNLINNKQKE